MTLYVATAEVRLGARAERDVTTFRKCAACGAPLDRLAWRERRPPYHWRPFGLMCSACNSIYVGPEARLLHMPEDNSTQLAGLIERHEGKPKAPRKRKASVQAP